MWVEPCSNHADFICPHCGIGLDVKDWDSEYGDPHDAIFNCPACGKPIEIIVVTTIDIRKG